MKRWLLLIFLLPGLAQAATVWCSATADGSGDGSSKANAAATTTCFNSLSAGDTAMYVAENYGGIDFRPNDNGTSGNRIVHECESLHGCVFDQGDIDVNFIDIVRIASDSDFYDSSKSDTNPRFQINGNNVTLEAVFIRGEPQICASPNPTPGCGGSDPANRYNDLLQFQSGSNNIKLLATDDKGPTQLINGNHDALTIFGDRDGTACEANESYFLIQGTPSTPVTINMQRHHGISIKSPCNVLFEHVDIVQAGEGRGDVDQPVNSTSVNTGAAIHPLETSRVLFRHSNISLAGSGTSEWRNLSGADIGLSSKGFNQVFEFGFAHVSVYRTWGPAFVIGRANAVTDVDDLRFRNIAIDESWYLRRTEGASVTDSPYAQYVFARTGATTNVSADIDGVCFNNVSEYGTDRFLRDTAGTNTNLQSADCPTTVDGVACGSSITYDTGPFFNDPGNRDFEPIDACLTGNGVGVAETTNSGTGSTIAVDAAYMFRDDMNGLRSAGDKVDINGDTCNITSINYNGNTITCNESFTWASGEAIRYYDQAGTTLLDDIGSVSDGSSPPPPPPPPPDDPDKRIRVVTKTLPATATTTDFTVADAGTPDCAVIMGGTGLFNYNLAAHASLFVGVIDNDTSAVVSVNAEDNVATTDTDRYHNETNVAAVTTAGSSTPDRTATGALITDGVRLTTGESGAEYQVTAIMAYGVGCEAFSAGDATADPFAFNVAHGFDSEPKAGLVFYNGAGSQGEAGGTFSSGFWTNINNTIRQFAFSYSAENGAAAGSSSSTVLEGEVAALHADAASLTHTISVTGVDTTNVTFTGSAVPTGDIIGIALELDDFAVFANAITSPTDANSEQDTSPNFEPQFMFAAMSPHTAIDDSKTGNCDAGSFGLFATDFSEDVTYLFLDEFNADPTNTQSEFRPAPSRRDCSGTVALGATVAAIQDGIDWTIFTQDSTARVWPALFIATSLSSGVVLGPGRTIEKTL